MYHTVFFKEKINYWKKHNKLNQIYLHELQNDLILPIGQCGFISTSDDEDIVYIGDNSLQKYMSKHVKSTRNINKTTCVYETCISSILLQSD